MSFCRERKEFGRLWVIRGGFLEHAHDNQGRYKNANLYYVWLPDSIEPQRPVDQIVPEFSAPMVGTFKNPATTMTRSRPNKLPRLENHAPRSFNEHADSCAQCHNHPSTVADG